MDAGMFRLVNGLAGHVDGIDDTFEVIARFAPLALLGILALSWFWPGGRPERDRRQWAVLAAVAAAAIALGVNQVIIHLWDRPRPFVSHHATLLLAPSHDPSFPSDHATFGFAIAVALVLASKRVGMLALFVAALVALARVYVGEHYVSDVAAGAVVGGTIAIMASRLLPYLAPIIEPPLRLARRVHLA